MNASTFNLSDEVKAILHSTSISDPSEIALKVAESVPEHMLRECLRVTMREYVTGVIRFERNIANSTGNGQSTTATQSSSATAGGQSWKRDGIRQGWRSRLMNRYYVAGQWMLLGEMTHDHLVAAAIDREELAAANTARAAQLRLWAALIHESNVQTFGDLPEDVQARVLS